MERFGKLAVLTLWVMGLASALDEAAKQAVVEAHNACRDGTNANLQNVVWNDAIAAKAQEYAETLTGECQMAHSSDELRKSIVGFENERAGENVCLLKYENQPNATADVTQCTNLWCAENEFYDYENNTCSDVCGHYKQVVWDVSTQIGCARVPCDQNEAGNYTFITVCQYQEGGNKGDGEVTFRPYGRLAEEVEPEVVEEEEAYCTPSVSTVVEGERTTTTTVTCEGSCRKVTEEWTEGTSMGMSMSMTCQGK